LRVAARCAHPQRTLWQARRLAGAARHEGAGEVISAIVPVDLARRPANLLCRLNRLLDRAKAQGLRIVIGHNNRGKTSDRVLKELCTHHRMQLVSDDFYTGAVNAARLRNEAIPYVSTPLTLLLDVDIHLEADVLARVATSVLTDDKPFQVLPCLYLSRRGSADLMRRHVGADDLLNDYLSFRRAPFLHMAIPSSVTVFRTEDYQRAGAFDSGFTGHGYEDLDFLLRLAWLHGEIPRSSELLIDSPVRAPLLTSGFRGQLARLALPSLLQRQVAFHLWHSTSRDVYYEARKRNASHFQRKLAAQLTAAGAAQGVPPGRPAFDLSLVSAWSDMCRRSNVDANDYSVLFDNRPGHADRLDTPMRRLIPFRPLLDRPGSYRRRYVATSKAFWW
jgi:predicted glycosyltransferase involved in capsule biosynthesis